MRAFRSAFLLAVLLGCPPPPVPPEPDAGGTTITLIPPAPAVPPEPTTLLPCAPGWQEVPGTDGAPTTCEPWALGSGGGCAIDQGHFAGEPACRVVGTTCTADDFASGLPTSFVLFVKAQAPAGGTGSRASPFNTIAAAMTAATANTVLALSKGTFTETVRLKAGVTLWGACVAQTALLGVGAAPTVATGGLGSTVKNLRVGGPAVGILVNPSGNSLELDDLIVDGAVGVAILVGNRAIVTGHDVVVRNTRVSPASGTGGRAVSAEYGAQVTLGRAVLEDNAENAINVAEPGSKVIITDGVIRGTRPRRDGAMGRAATLRNRATLELTRVVVEQNQETALLDGDASTLVLTDVLVRETRSSTNNDGGDGLVVEAGATATLTRVAFLHNRSLGLAVRSQGQLTATHLVVLDTEVTASTRVDGGGLDVREGSQVTLDHAFIARSHSAAIAFAFANGALRDVDLRATSRSDADDASSGLQIRAGARVTVARVRVSGSERVGVLVSDPNSILTGTDLTIADSRCTSQGGEDGTGLGLQAGAAADLRRLSLTGNKSIGLQVLGASATLADVSITDTSSACGPGDLGRGLHLQEESFVLLDRALISHAADVGVMVGLGSTLKATELRVEDVGKRACSIAQTCPDLGGSAVVVLSAGSSFEATGFSFARSVQCGLQLAEDGVATVSRGEIVGHVIGACVLTAGFDLARLSDQVTYLDNQRKLDAASVPLPAVRVPPLR